MLRRHNSCTSPSLKPMLIQIPFPFQERYKQDINLAIQLLHCKPDSFLPQKINSVCKAPSPFVLFLMFFNQNFDLSRQLPLETQSKVAAYMKLDCQSDSECSVGNLSKAKYQILPTDEDVHGAFASKLAYLETNEPRLFTDHNRSGEISVSPVVVAKYLENELKLKNPKHCSSCHCASKNLIDLDGMQTSFNIAIQTDVSTLSCIRCNSALNSPTHTTSPYLIKLKSSDSVISETKSSVSDFANLMDKTPYTPSKKDDLMVNPILGHHRLCEHTKNFSYQPKEDEAPKVKETLKSPKKENGKCDKARVDGEVAEKQTTPLSHGAGNGSSNSLWSKESSNKEGAKMFETFNRNLIKTMQVH